jgi:hypothetical protein
MRKFVSRLPGVLAEKCYSLWGSNYKYVFYGLLLLSLLPILFGGCGGGQSSGGGSSSNHN